MTETELLNRIYNLILSRHIFNWEREQLMNAKNQLENNVSQTKIIDDLEIKFRPLAIRQTLSPKVQTFYDEITGKIAVDSDENKRTFIIENTVKFDSAIFAGGCFWCLIEPFDSRAGIISVVSGFTGGTVKNPTYTQVLSHTTGHVEAVEIIFDPDKISYSELLEIYWSLINPTDIGGQFLDRGERYRPIIFVKSDEQRKLAEKSKQERTFVYDEPIIVEIREASEFWIAEEYHQDWYKKNPKRYKAMKRARKHYYNEYSFLKFFRRRKNNGKISS